MSTAPRGMTRTLRRGLAAGLLAAALPAWPQIGGAKSLLQAVAKPGAPASAASATQAPPLAEQRERVRQALSAARTKAAANNSSALAAEQERLLERLLVVIEVRLRAEVESGAPVRSDALLASPAMAMLKLPGPYPVPLIDALRDERDALAQHAALLDDTLTTHEANLTRLTQEHRSAVEALRLHRERVATHREPRDAPRTAEKEAVALLRVELQEAELLQTSQARDRTRDQQAAARAQLQQLDAELTRVAMQPRLSDDDFAQVVEEIASRRQRLAREARDNDQQIAKLARELEATTDVATVSARQRELVSRRATRSRLAELDAIEQATHEAWRQRAALLGATSGETRRAADERITRAVGVLSARAALDAGLENAARAASLEQNERVKSLPVGTPELAAERSVLQALDLHAGVQERSRRAITSLTNVYTRSREELQQQAKDRGFGDRITDSAGAVRAFVRRVWEFELFEATDSAVVDGQTLSVSYGVTVGKSIGALLLFVLGYWIASHATRFGERLLVSRFGVAPQFARVLRRWLLFTGGVAVLLIVLNLARIPLTIFAFLGGALAIGIGFGTQNIIKNVISGIIILFERKVRVGDIVTIGNVTGTVSAVDLRATSVRGFDGIEAILPNSNLLENLVSNWTYPTPLLRRSVRVGIAYSSDAEAAADIVSGRAAAHESVLADPAPYVLLEDFGDNGLELSLLYWMKVPGPLSGPQVDSQLRFAILDALRSAGIGIAYPQRDVHLDLLGPVRVELPPHASSDQRQG